MFGGSNTSSIGAWMSRVSTKKQKHRAERPQKSHQKPPLGWKGPSGDSRLTKHHNLPTNIQVKKMCFVCFLRFWYIYIYNKKKYLFIYIYIYTIFIYIYVYVHIHIYLFILYIYLSWFCLRKEFVGRCFPWIDFTCLCLRWFFLRILPW